MRVGIVRMGMAMWLAGCICQAVCQTSGSPNYLEFFQKVVVDKPRGTGPILLNGQPVDIHIPTVQESTGLTDREMTELQGIAADCTARLDEVSRQHPDVVFDALMESIETGKDTSGVAAQQLKELSGQRSRIVLAHVQLLKAALGDARFQEFDARLRAEEASRPKMVRK